MFRFIMMIMLLVASFFAGRVTAAEAPIPFIVEDVELQAEVTPQEILAFVRSNEVKTRFPDLHRKLLVFLATPQMQAQLANPNRSSSPLYQKLAELVILIRSKLNE